MNFVAVEAKNFLAGQSANGFVMLTGGDAELFSKHLQVDHHIGRGLVLDGLALLCP